MSSGETSYWNGIAGDWLDNPQRLWRSHSDAVNNALLARWLPADQAGRILKTDLFDEAVGEGLGSLLRSRAHSVTGIDVSLSAALAAQSRPDGIPGALADVRFLPFADATFDVVVSNSTLDHFASAASIAASLQEIHRVLRTHGQLLLTLDNPANPVVAVRNALPFRLLNRLAIVPYFVGATYGPRRLPRLLGQLGFEVLAVEAVMHCPRLLAVAALRALERRTAPKTQKRLLRFLLKFERLSASPTRFLTGHFVTVKALKR